MLPVLRPGELVDPQRRPSSFRRELSCIDQNLALSTCRAVVLDDVRLTRSVGGSLNENVRGATIEPLRLRNRRGRELTPFEYSIDQVLRRRGSRWGRARRLLRRQQNWRCQRECYRQAMNR